VWVTYPRTVAEALVEYRQLALLGASADAIAEHVLPSEASAAKLLGAAAATPGSTGTRVFCPIWKDPWMAVGGDTYCHDILRLCGGLNVFAELEDKRYPTVTDDDIVQAAPEVILLPSEPFEFGAEHAANLAKLPIPAAVDGRIHLVDGTLLSWYGPRIHPALCEFSALLR
jgi:ABC-type Fe3+-hydroxamate transport system substrate-binding protein